MKETLAPEATKFVKLKEWLLAREIELVLFDLDDTCINTHKVFDDQTLKFIQQVQIKFPSLDAGEISQTFSELEIRFYSSHLVNPGRYPALVTELAGIYQTRPYPGIGKVFQENLPVLMEIYKTVPEFYPGAEEALGIFKATGFEMGVVTHGNLAWTNLKIKELDLRRFFRHFWIALEDDFKSSQDWLSAINMFPGKKPENTLVVGDNVKGDILASHLVGVKHKVLIPSPWSVYAEGEIPKGVLTVPEIGQLVDFLLSNR